MTSNGHPTGTFVSGGSNAQFDGFWYAELLFTLPAGASNVSLAFSALQTDDRAVLQLNGSSIGDVVILGGAGAGKMALPPGLPDVNYSFTGQTSGTITSGFVFGATNSLRLVVNNTGSADPGAPTHPFWGADDWTGAAFHGSLSYDVPAAPEGEIPEPATVGLLLSGLAALALLRRVGTETRSQ